MSKEKEERDQRVICEYRRRCIEGCEKQGDALFAISKQENIHQNTVLNILKRHNIITEWKVACAKRTIAAASR